MTHAAPEVLQTPPQAPQAPLMRGLPIVGLVPRMMKDPLGLYTEAQRRFGPVVRLDLGRLGTYHLVTPPEGVHEVLTEGKRREFPALQLLLSAGLVILPTGDAWRGQRRMMQPLFSRGRLAQLHTHIVAAVAGELEGRWAAAARAGEAIDVGLELRAVAFRVILQAMFGSALTADIEMLGRDLSTVLDFVQVRMLSLVKLPLHWPLPSHRRFAEARARLKEIAARLVAQRRAEGGAGGDDLLGMLLSARDEETGAEMSDEQIHGEVLTMVLAGYETTSTALTWTLWLLARHPEILGRLKAEVDAVLGGRAPEFADMAALTYTRKVLLEGDPIVSAGLDDPPRLRRAAHDLRGSHPGEPAGGAVSVGDASTAGALARPGALRPGALRGQDDGRAPAPRVHPVRGRAAPVHRERVCAGRGGGGAGDDRAAL
jgi:cytochrome P450